MLISELGSSQSMAQQAEANEKLEPQNAPMPELQSAADAGSRKPEAFWTAHPKTDEVQTQKQRRDATMIRYEIIHVRRGSRRDREGSRRIINQPARVDLPYCISHFTCIVTTFDLL